MQPTQTTVQKRILRFLVTKLAANHSCSKTRQNVGAAHTHYHTQVTYVASGKFEFTINGETKVVSAGDALYMEPDVKHGCKCLEPGLLIDCFSPMRETFLQK